jgi:putative N6-adenine-specific DNA methylase
LNTPSEKALARRVRQHVNGKEHEFFAIVQPGFEATAGAELREIGIESVGEPVEGGIPFTARLDGGYRANLASRTISRILMRLSEFKADGFDRFAKKAVAFPWELYLPAEDPVAFRVDSTRSRLYHEGRIEEEIREAIDMRLEAHGLRVEFGDGGQTVFVRLHENRCRLSLDTSGGLLYRRGRRPFVAEASIRETLAAAILREAGWPAAYDTLIDPMCGAGTFSREAMEMAAGDLPNADRAFAFLTWPAFRPAAFEHLKKDLAAPADPSPKRILTSDVDADAVATAKKNLGEHPVEVRDFLDALPPEDDARRLYILNPPYGKRLRGVDARGLYRKIGERIRSDPGAGYAIIVPELELEKVLSLPREKKILFRNGGIRVAAIVHRPG